MKKIKNSQPQTKFTGSYIKKECKNFLVIIVTTPISGIHVIKGSFSYYHVTQTQNKGLGDINTSRCTNVGASESLLIERND